jgi:hypothetical protein
VAHQDNPQSRARSRAWTWPEGILPGKTWPTPDLARLRGGFVVPARVREWAALEVGAGRLVPWFAVAYGFGIVLYFTAEREPAWWAATGLAVVCAIGAVVLRRHIVAFVMALGLFGTAAGFAGATIKTVLIDHPVLRQPGIMAQTPQA